MNKKTIIINTILVKEHVKLCKIDSRIFTRIISDLNETRKIFSNSMYIHKPDLILNENELY